MSRPPRLPLPKTGDNEYVHIRSLVANIHKPKNVSRPPVGPVVSVETESKLAVVRESPVSSDSDRSRAGSERSDVSTEEVTPGQRVKSNSIAALGATLVPPEPKRRRASFLHLHMGGAGAGEHAGPLSAGAHLSVPRFTVTAPPGEQRRVSHGFSAFHGFALRRHSNTVCVCLQV